MTSSTTALSLFSIPSFIYHVPQWENLKEDFLSTIDWDDPQCNRENIYTDYYKYYGALKRPPYYKDLLTILDPVIKSFLSEQTVIKQLNQKARIPSAWCQRYTSNQMHPVHTHGAIGYSSVFYAQMCGSHQPTMFLSPFLEPWTGFPEETVPDCKEGDIIFFPSQLLHQSLPFQSDDARIIFSFNISPTPR